MGKIVKNAVLKTTTAVRGVKVAKPLDRVTVKSLTALHQKDLINVQTAKISFHAV